MHLIPTLEGGLKIQLDSVEQISLFEHILSDAGGKEETLQLARSLGKKMDDEWDQFISPELSDRFFQDLKAVKAEIKKASELSEPEIFITPDTASEWYSSLNQARLSLEEHHDLSQIKAEDEIDPDKLDPELFSALVRDDLYLHIQSMLLEYVMN